MTVEVEGMAELKRNLAKLEVSFGKEIKDALVMGGLLVETEAKKSIQEVSSGRQVTRYRNSGTKKEHIAAAAGESPNTDTGALVRSVVTEVNDSSVFVGSSLEYASWLELGTVNMKPRPFLHPALMAKQSKINELFIRAAKDAIKNASTN